MLSPLSTMLRSRFGALAAALLFPVSAAAQVFDGGGIDAGVNAASGITGVNDDDPRTAVINVIEAVLNYAALIAVVTVIIAGFYLILSLGDDEGKDKAKKIIQYTLIGLLVILFSRIIVALVTVWLPAQI